MKDDQVIGVQCNNYRADSCDNENYVDDYHFDDNLDNQWCRPIPSVWLQGHIDDDENGLHWKQ